MTTICSASTPLAAEHRDGAAALRAVAADDGVVVQASPPGALAEGLPRALGQHLQRGADEQDEEEDPGRCDDDGRRQSCPRRDRRDVAVAGRGDRDGRVVQGVEEAHRRPVQVAVPVPAEPGDERDDEDERQGDRDPDAERPEAGRCVPWAAAAVHRAPPLRARLRPVSVARALGGMGAPPEQPDRERREQRRHDGSRRDRREPLDGGRGARTREAHAGSPAWNSDRSVIGRWQG